MKTTEERLEALAGPGVVVLTIPQVAHALGQNGPGAVQSIRNQLARGDFPIRGRKRGKEWVFSIRLVAEWIDVIEGNAKPPAVRQYKDGALVSMNGRAVRQKRMAYVGAAYARLLTAALDDWLREYQAREAATLGGAIDEAMPDLPPYRRGPRTP
ncbi:TPA: hypothetical protein QDB31_004282 [Burkholderia vietnamiensis]|nr:hypothetical protein [Burkholderia vietnamiensis]